MGIDDELLPADTQEVSIEEEPAVEGAERTGDAITDERFDFGLFLTAVQELSREEGPTKALQRLFDLDALKVVNARERLTEILEALTAVPWFRPLLNPLMHELKAKLNSGVSVEEAVKTLSIDVNLPDGAVFLIDLSYYTLFTSNTPDLSQQKVLFDEFSKTMLGVCAKYEAYAMQPPPGDCWIVVVHPLPGQSAEAWKTRREQCFRELHEAANRVEMPNAELFRAHPGKFPVIDGKPRFQAKGLARTFTRGELQILGLTGPDGLQGLFAAGGYALDALKSLEKKVAKNGTNVAESFHSEVEPVWGDDSSVDLYAFVLDTVREPRLALALSAALIQMMPRGSFSTWADEKLHQNVEGDSKVELAQNAPDNAVIVLKIPQSSIPAEFFKGLLVLRAEHPKFNLLKPDGDKLILYCNNYGGDGGVNLQELMNFLAGLRNLLKANQLPVRGYVASGNSFVVMPLARGKMPVNEYSAVALIQGARACAAGKQSEGFAIDASIALGETSLRAQELSTTVADGMNDLQFLNIKEEDLPDVVDGNAMINILETHGGRALIGRDQELARILEIASQPGKPLSLCLVSSAPGVGVSALMRPIPNAHLITQKKGTHPFGAVAALIEKVAPDLPNENYSDVLNSSQALLRDVGRYFGKDSKSCIALDLPRYTPEEAKFFTLFRNALAGLGSVTIFHNDALIFEVQGVDKPESLEVRPLSAEDAAAYILECRANIPEHLHPRIAQILEQMSPILQDRVPFVPRNLRKVAKAIKWDGSNLVFDDAQLLASMVSGGQLVAKALAEGLSIADQTVLSVIGAVGVPMSQNQLVAVLHSVTGFEVAVIRAALQSLHNVPKDAPFLRYESEIGVVLRDPDMAFAVRGLTSFSVEHPDRERLLAQAVIAQVQSIGFPRLTESNEMLIMAFLDHLYKSGDSQLSGQIKDYVQCLGNHFYKKADLSAARQIYGRYLKRAGGFPETRLTSDLDFYLEISEAYRQSSHQPHRLQALDGFALVEAHPSASSEQKLRAIWGKSRLHGVRAIENFGELHHSVCDESLMQAFSAPKHEPFVKIGADRSAYSLALKREVEVVDPSCSVSMKVALHLMSLMERSAFIDPYVKGGFTTSDYKVQAKPLVQAELDECVQEAGLEDWLEGGELPPVFLSSDLPHVATALRLASNVYNALGDYEKAASYAAAAATIFSELSSPDFKQELDSVNNGLFAEAYRLHANALTIPLPTYFRNLADLKKSALELEQKSLLMGDIANQYAALVLQSNVCDLALMACVTQQNVYLEFGPAEQLYLEGSDLVRRMNLLAPLCGKLFGNQRALDSHWRQYQALIDESGLLAAR